MNTFSRDLKGMVVCFHNSELASCLLPQQLGTLIHEPAKGGEEMIIVKKYKYFIAERKGSDKKC